MGTIVKGASLDIEITFYRYWSGDDATSQRANLTGNTNLSCMFKNRATDLDSVAVFSLAGTIVDAVNGVATFPLLPANTIALSQAKLFYQGQVKLADTKVVKTKIMELELDGTLFQSAP